MIFDILYRFRDGVGPDLLTVGTTEKLSNPLDLVAEKINDGGGNLFLAVTVKDKGNAAAGATFDVKLVDCDTSGGTYRMAMGKTLTLAEVQAEGQVYLAALPARLKRYARASIQGGASMTGGATFNVQIITT
jgi:hypothetical protein